MVAVAWIDKMYNGVVEIKINNKKKNLLNVSCWNDLNEKKDAEFHSLLKLVFIVMTISIIAVDRLCIS